MTGYGCDRLGRQREGDGGGGAACHKAEGGSEGEAVGQGLREGRGRASGVNEWSTQLLWTCGRKRWVEGSPTFVLCAEIFSGLAKLHNAMKSRFFFVLFFWRGRISGTFFAGLLGVRGEEGGIGEAGLGKRSRSMSWFLHCKKNIKVCCRFVTFFFSWQWFQVEEKQRKCHSCSIPLLPL